MQSTDCRVNSSQHFVYSPALYGRVLQAEDFIPGKSGVVVLSHALWEQRFGADPTVIGRSIILDAKPVTVAGVMRADFDTGMFEQPRQIWAPRLPRPNDGQMRSAAYLYAVARLKPKVSPQEAEEEMAPVARQLAEQFPRSNAGVGVRVESFQDFILGQVRPALLLLFGAVVFVLLIACANAANLQLARNSEKQRSFAIRSALGASRLRLVRQMLSESLLISLMAGLLGVVLALAAVRLLVGLGGGIIPRLENCTVDLPVLGFSLALSVATALVFGLLPTLHLTRPDLQNYLRDGGRTLTAGLSGRRIRSALIVAEVALAVVLLVGAGLLIRSFYTLLQEDPGFASESLVGLQVFAWDRNPTAQARIDFFRESLQEIATLPDVVQAGAASAVPFYGASIDVDTNFTIVGRQPADDSAAPPTFVTIATEAYFSTLRVPLHSGRSFLESDIPTSPPVVVVNTTLADRHWPGKNPVGERIVVRYGQPVEREIVGVVQDTKHLGLDSVPRSEIFIPHAQSGSGELIYVVRTRAEPQRVLPSIKQAIWNVDPKQAFYAVVVIEDLISESVAARRLNLSLLASFGALALLLAAIGIYSVIGYITRQRTHEIGIRVMVGAQSNDILQLILTQGVGLAALGLGIGLLASLGLARLLSNMLYGIGANDPLTFFGITVILLLVASRACLLPARRATRVDPLVALRQG